MGYRPYEVLLVALEQLTPDLKPIQHATDADAYARYWGRITRREVAEVQAPPCNTASQNP